MNGLIGCKCSKTKLCSHTKGFDESSFMLGCQLSASLPASKDSSTNKAETGIVLNQEKDDTAGEKVEDKLRKSKVQHEAPRWINFVQVALQQSLH